MFPRELSTHNLWELGIKSIMAQEGVAGVAYSAGLNKWCYSVLEVSLPSPFLSGDREFLLKFHLVL